MRSKTADWHPTQPVMSVHVSELFTCIEIMNSCRGRGYPLSSLLIEVTETNLKLG